MIIHQMRRNRGGRSTASPGVRPLRPSHTSASDHQFVSCGVYHPSERSFGCEGEAGRGLEPGCLAGLFSNVWVMAAGCRWPPRLDGGPGEVCAGSPAAWCRAYGGPWPRRDKCGSASAGCHGRAGWDTCGSGAVRKCVLPRRAWIRRGVHQATSRTGPRSLRHGISRAEHLDHRWQYH